jgi:hypothetical protein
MLDTLDPSRFAARRMFAAASCETVKLILARVGPVGFRPAPFLEPPLVVFME